MARNVTVPPLTLKATLKARRACSRGALPISCARTSFARSLPKIFQSCNYALGARETIGRRRFVGGPVAATGSAAVALLGIAPSCSKAPYLPVQPGVMAFALITAAAAADLR
jgi:hypothetical protein